MALFLILAATAVAEEPVWVRASIQVDGCSGTVITADGYGVGAGHCAKVDRKFNWVGYDNKTKGKGRWLYVDEKRDLALFKIDKPIAHVRVPRRLPAGPITGCGWPEGSGPERLRLRYSNREEFSNLTGDRWVFAVEAGKFRNGNSGGGVFIGADLVAVMTHGVDDQWVYGCRHEVLSAFLSDAEQAIQAVFLPPPGVAKPLALGTGWGDNDRTREIKALQKRVAALEKLLSSKQSPVPGPPGPPGPRGEPGPVGSTDTGLNDRLISLEDWRENFKAVIRVKIAPQKEKTNGE